MFRRISKALHRLYDDVSNEPLSERWVDLINRLNESEQRAAEARARVQFADQSSRACVEQSRRSLADLQQSIKDAEPQIQRTRELFAQARRDKKSN